jgi:hypothetical protein
MLQRQARRDCDRRWDRTRHSRQKGDRGRILGESDEFRKLQRAMEKAQGDHAQAVRNVCRLYAVRTLDALPGAIRAATLALLGPSV